jgi:hypothetical protein
MFTEKFTTCFVLLLAVQATNALAQSRGDGTAKYFQPVQTLPPELGFSYDHASTAFEGALRGRAQLLHATGSYWLNSSQAQLYYEQARSLALENRRVWIESRAADRERIAANRARRTAERNASNKRERSAKFEVYRLSAAQLDRRTGTIVWPATLQAAEYSGCRQTVETVFRDRATTESWTSDDREEVIRCVRNALDVVRRNRASVPKCEYLAAAKFLCGIKHEAEYPLENSGTQLEADTVASR